MTTEYIPDVGSRLTHGGKSMILQSISFGDGALTDSELLSMVGAISQFIDEIAERVLLGERIVRIVSAEPTAALDSDVAYKFTDDLGASFWAKGSIKLNPPAVYHAIENVGARDTREGLGHVYLQDEKQFATFTSASGFNSVVLCTSSDGRRSERQERHRRFGPRLLRINRASDFAAKIAAHICAERFQVRDVVYSDAKVVKGTTSHLAEWLSVNGTGDLKPAFLEYLAEHHLDELIRVTEAASVFCKPSDYRIERERRFLFSMPEDVSQSMVVDDPALADHIEVLV